MLWTKYARTLGPVRDPDLAWPRSSELLYRVTNHLTSVNCRWSALIQLKNWNAYQRTIPGLISVSKESASPPCGLPMKIYLRLADHGVGRQYIFWSSSSFERSFWSPADLLRFSNYNWFPSRGGESQSCQKGRRYLYSKVRAYLNCKFMNSIGGNNFCVARVKQTILQKVNWPLKLDCQWANATCCWCSTTMGRIDVRLQWSCQNVFLCQKA